MDLDRCLGQGNPVGNVKDPMWKTVLNWGAVLAFFLLPITFFIVHLYALTHIGWLGKPLSGEEKYDFSYVQNLQRDITFLVFGLAGLRSWEVIRNGNNNRKEKEA